MNILANRIMTLQQQQQAYVEVHPPPLFNPFLFFQPLPELMTKPVPFSTTINEQPSRDSIAK